MDSGNGKGKDWHRDKHKVECYNCHKTGHYKSECWAKGGGKEGQGPWQGKGTKEDAALAEEEQEEMEVWVAMEEVPMPAEASGTRAANAAAAAAGQSPA